ncbi:MAG: di-trans,poly-cis-decaprenylcistransferase [Nanoarchaeota archaeon]|nr:di-trans,poly-cis-decaprenylcistransferase [Nanoarchaeota archaeon]
MTTEKGLHVGIILDGNRRWAKARGLQPWQGHDAGAKAFKKLLNEMKDTGVKQLTVYSLSLQNLKRTEEEKKHLFRIFSQYFKELKSEPAIVENQIKISFIGRTELLPDDLQQTIGDIINNTKNYEGYKLNFAIAYGGREEIVDAVKNIVEKVKKGQANAVDEELIKGNLYLADEPDFIIRTGGDRRTSNFLTWQSSYSEWFFLDKYWPDFTTQDLMDCIEQFKKRERRFGK